MDDGRGAQLRVCPEDNIHVQDHGRTATPFPRSLSQYLSADISARLVNPCTPRTLAIMDQEILSIDSIIESLQILRIVKSQMRNRFAPISRLPPEILAEIFITCIDHSDHLDSSSNDEPEKLNLRLILGQVCSAWRSVAWGLPMLWTTVHCRISHPKNSQKLAGLLFQWLMRARGLLVSVKIDFLDEEAWAKLDMHAPIDILLALAPFHHHVKALDLILPGSWEDHLHRQTSVPFHCLEELRIRPPAPIQYHKINVDAFFHASKLYSISYQSYLLRHLHLPWTNLTQAEFGGPSVDEIVELLSRCTGLVTCKICNPIPDEQIYPISPIVHNSLQDLRISIRQGESVLPPVTSINVILDLLTVPYIQDISLKLPIDHDSPLQSINELIERSLCSLRAVEVLGPAISEDQVINFLSESTVGHLHNG